MIMMDKKLKMEEMDLVSGGMTTQEWVDYERHYDIAMYRAQLAGNKELLAKLTRERPRLAGISFELYEGIDKKKYGIRADGRPPFVDLKLEDMPNVELVYKMGGRKAS